MKANVGGFDRGFRVILGVVLIGLGFFYQNWWGAIGIIPLATGLVGWCPLYAPFKFSTRKSH